MDERGNSDDRTWVWTPVDEGFHFEIPPRERIPPMATDAGRNGRSKDLEPSWVPDLRGRTLEEVK